MGKLNNYKLKKDHEDAGSTEEPKEDNFKYKLISSHQEFDKWYNNEAQQYSVGYFFRGVNEAKYKLYTSLQRTWWSLDFTRGIFGSIQDPNNYIKFLETLMTKARAWNNGILEEYFKNLNSELDDFSLLSLMQRMPSSNPVLWLTMVSNSFAKILLCKVKMCSKKCLST